MNNTQEGDYRASRATEIETREAVPVVAQQCKRFIASDAAEVGRIESEDQVTDLVARQNGG